LDNSHQTSMNTNISTAASVTNHNNHKNDRISLAKIQSIIKPSSTPSTRALHGDMELTCNITCTDTDIADTERERERERERASSTRQSVFVGQYERFVPSCTDSLPSESNVPQSLHLKHSLCQVFFTARRLSDANGTCPHCRRSIAIRITRVRGETSNNTANLELESEPRGQIFADLVRVGWRVG